MTPPRSARPQKQIDVLRTQLAQARAMLAQKQAACGRRS